MTGVAKAAQETSVGAGETRTAATELAQMAAALHDLVGRQGTGH